MLSIFAHRFMAIAEQMGRALQKTSVSTNVKERLDYSCALFDSTGGLVANAPHLPVHLGSMCKIISFPNLLGLAQDIKRGCNSLYCVLPAWLFSYRAPHSASGNAY